MPNISDIERICMIFQGVCVSFRFSDSSQINVPHEAVCRSKLLRQTLRDAEQDNLVNILLPRGLLQNWLRCLDVLHSTAVEEGSAAVYKVCTKDTDILEFLKVRRSSFVSNCIY